MTAVVLRGDAARLPLPDACVDLIVTSPPYYGLRSYTDGGEHYAGQIGSEATPAEYVAALVACTREWCRVLKPCGSLFVNLGDKYAGGGMGGHSDGLVGTPPQGEGNAYRRIKVPTPSKSLLGLPWRYALAATDELGLILRAEIIWAKPNGLPESVQDRVRRAHEQVFHFTRQPRYYSAVDEIREPHALKTLTHRGGGESWGNQRNPDNNWGDAKVRMVDPLGKLPGSVWQIPSQPLTVPPQLGVDHFAAFPMELPRRIIQGWSPQGICTACGEGRRPIASASRDVFYGNGRHRSGAQQVKDGAAVSGWAHDEKWRTTTTITGYACSCCDCHELPPTRPAVVLDPFGGTGTTALLADALGRTGISVDMSGDYCRLARWRTTDPAQRAAALQVDKPPQEVTGQAELFEVG